MPPLAASSMWGRRVRRRTVRDGAASGDRAPGAAPPLRTRAPAAPAPDAAPPGPPRLRLARRTTPGRPTVPRPDSCRARAGPPAAFCRATPSAACTATPGPSPCHRQTSHAAGPARVCREGRASAARVRAVRSTTSCERKDCTSQRRMGKRDGRVTASTPRRSTTGMGFSISSPR